MTTREAVERLLLAGVPAAEAARRVGVTRQRASFIARTIGLPAVRRKLDDAAARRVAADYTAGVPMAVIYQRYNVGKAAVLRVLAELAVPRRPVGHPKRPAPRG